MGKCRKMFFYVGAKLFDSDSEKGKLGYLPNVQTFMKRVGTYVDEGSEWEFYLNTKGGNTMIGPLRKFQYYAPKAPSEETHWNKDVQKWLATSSSQSMEAEIKTGALRLEHGGEEVEISSDKKVFKVANCSGRSTVYYLDQLVDKLENAIEADDHVFAVCDCNCFHNSAYVFGLLALNRRVNQEASAEPLECPAKIGKELNVLDEYVCTPVLIVNIDQHNDFKREEGRVDSDGWGQPLLRKFDYGAYVAVGLAGGANLVGIKTLDEEPKAIKPGVQLPTLFDYQETIRRGNDAYKRVKAKFQKLWIKLEKEMKFPFKYAYLTIDRDCMAFNHTQWGHRGSIFKNRFNVYYVADAIIESFREIGIALAGLDVTGLPEDASLKAKEPDSIKGMRSLCSVKRARAPGKVSIVETGKSGLRSLAIAGEIQYEVDKSAKLKIKNGQTVKMGSIMVEASSNSSCLDDQSRMCSDCQRLMMFELRHEIKFLEKRFRENWTKDLPASWKKTRLELQTKKETKKLGACTAVNAVTKEPCDCKSFVPHNFIKERCKTCMHPKSAHMS
ncbi:MAG: hypothetical protein JSW59_12220 [Phycisphaerales bacterium]|nr:MAG: hypothetical protein JSW59_12220 [Phycisphaerales bacterium]